MATRKYVYFAEIDRFGYTLQAIGFSKNEVRDAMINEYIRAYKQINDVDPSNEDEGYDYQYYQSFLNDLYIDKRELNKVEWR